VFSTVYLAGTAEVVVEGEEVDWEELLAEPDVVGIVLLL